MNLKYIGAVVIVGSIFAAGVAVGQQSTSRREPQFENSEVQVWKSIISPGTPLGQHRHDHGGPGSQPDPGRHGGGADDHQRRS